MKDTLPTTERWTNREEEDDYLDTGTPIDDDYIAAHEHDRTVSVGHGPLSTETVTIMADGGDGSGTKLDAIRDENAMRHTVANEVTSIIETTFYADRNGGDVIDWDNDKFTRLWLLHTGKDSHYRGSGANINPAHKEDKDRRRNYEEAQALLSGLGLNSSQKEDVLSAVRRMDLRRFTHLCTKGYGTKWSGGAVGATEMTTLGLLVCVLRRDCDKPLSHPAVIEVAAKVECTDVEYVAEYVAEKTDFTF